MELQGKHTIELNFAGDQLFMNYWDWAHGHDVVARIVDGQILLIDYEGDVEVTTPISFTEYLELVKESIRKIEI